MNPILPLVFVSLANLLLGILVLVRNRKDKINIYFSLFILGLSLWSITTALFGVSLNAGTLISLVKVIYLSISIATVFFFLFSLHFAGSIGDSINKFLTYFAYSVLVISFPIILLPNSLLTEIVVEGSLKKPSFGFGFYLLSIFELVSFFSALGVLIKKYLKSKGSSRLQLMYLFFGGLVTVLITTISNIIMPQLGEGSFVWIGPSSTIIFVFAVTYSIVKHRLMDIRMVVARSVAYTILIATMAGFYAGAVMGIEAVFFPSAMESFNWTAGIIRTILAVTMAFSFQPLRRWITRVTDKVFFKNQYNANDFLDTLAHTISSTIVLIELIYKALDLAISQIKITRGLFVVLSESGAIIDSQASGYKDVPKIESADMQKLAKDGIIAFDELAETSQYKKILKKYDASISIPLKTESTVEGVILLGEKLSGDMYNQQDLKVFEIIAPEIAVAITNAKAFEKIEKFNVTLRQEIKKATSELEKKNQQLRELDKAKDEFISMASHQLRTPLTAIKGYLSMLLEGDAGEIKVSQYDFVNEAFQGANRMVGLINDLLNVSRMETGRFFLEPVEVDLDKLVSEEVKQLANHAKEKKLYLKYDKKGKVPTISADETKIRQVVMNFVDNALYYTTNGGVNVTLEADKSNVIFKVVDTGIGVPKEQQKNLFTKFYRADNARHVRPDGTGLGIYLAKRVMDDHGGELIFHSVEGKGSTFGFKFPINSKLKVKRVKAPAAPNELGPGVGELAAGIGVNPEVLKATQVAGIEHPLADSADKKELEKEVAGKN